MRPVRGFRYKDYAPLVKSRMNISAKKQDIAKVVDSASLERVANAHLVLVEPVKFALRTDVPFESPLGDSQSH